MYYAKKNVYVTIPIFKMNLDEDLYDFILEYLYNLFCSLKWDQWWETHAVSEYDCCDMFCKREVREKK